MVGSGGLKPGVAFAGAAIVGGTEALLMLEDDTLVASESVWKTISSSGWTEVKLNTPEPVGDGSLEMVEQVA